MTEYEDLAQSAAISFAVTAILVQVFARVARRVGLVDQPDSRKVHKDPVPLVGGMALFGGLSFALLIGDSPLGHYRALMAGSAALLIVGLLDDLHELSARARFAAQIMMVLLMAGWGGVYLENLGPLLGPWSLHLGWLAIPVTVFAAVGVINAVNLVDGMDGLAGTVVLVCLLGVAVTSDLSSSVEYMPLVVVTAAGVCAFLMFNIRWGGASRVFLGDAGSLCVGFIIAWLLIDLSQKPTPVIQPVTALWLLAVPLMDAVFVLIARMRQGRSPFAAAQDHLHHLFLRAGFSVNQTLSVIAVLAALLASLGIVGQWLGLAQYWRFAAFLGLSVAYYGILSRAWRRRRWLGRAVEGMAASS